MSEAESQESQEAKAKRAEAMDHELNEERAEREEKRRARKEKKRRYDTGEWAKDKAIECTMSLARAIQEAGGGLSEGLLDMTLRDFINRMAGQNNIRFVHLPGLRDDDPRCCRQGCGQEATHTALHESYTHACADHFEEAEPWVGAGNMRRRSGGE